MLRFTSPLVAKVAGLAGAARHASTSATINFDLTASFKLYECAGLPTSTTATKEELTSYLRTMLVCRRMETNADTLYKAKMIRGFCHLYVGQEACVVGMEAALRREDGVITAYRNHCHQLLRGDTVEGVLAELLGRRGGSAKGKGGSMHMYNEKFNYYGGNGIVGAQVPYGTGLALKYKMSKEDRVAIAAYGDGAANQGQIFEAMNMAQLWQLPVIYVCENNHYGMGTAVNRASASTEFYKRGQYIPGVKVGSRDVLAVREAFKYARTHALQKGPIVLELDTYRYYGHSMSDPGLYRSRDEISNWRSNNDPITLCRNLLLTNNLSTEDELKALEKEVRVEVDEATERAKAQPQPETAEVYRDIFQKEIPFIRGIELQTSVQAGQPL
eukprot:gnl/Hemi2/16073_TR5332_c0_g1_i1.p1 gnl/Hemi2/16073_TR5332_c0_g1~~gnl/Hemi2/16073_TR5332_c0_g1_i1.p1  ORF type:complete len:386 (+),score=119.03 gnl/Hemi2/16073_TR5332_c0_g1_i1:59-1216(+)